MSKVRVDRIENLNGDVGINVADLTKSIRTVASMVELRGIGGEREGQCIYLQQYYNNIPKAGAGMFVWRATATDLENRGTIVNPFSGTTKVGRWFRNCSGQATDPQWFGAVGNGIIDDTVALQSSITWAQTNGNEWYLPAGSFLTSTTLVQTTRLKAFGAGRTTAQIIYNGAQQGWLAQPPVSNGNNRFWSWEDFSIIPSVANQATYGLQITLKTGAYLSNFTIAKMEFGLFGTRGLYLDNSIGNTDGFFLGNIDRCWIQNGLLGDKIGDNMSFKLCTVTGKNDVRISGVPGARQVIFDQLNVTTTGGLISLLDLGEPTIRDCQLEHPGAVAYTGIFNCSVYLHNCTNPLIDSSTINPNNGALNMPAAAIAIDGTTTNPRIVGNDINKGTLYHVNADANVKGGFIDPSNTYYGDVASNYGASSTFKGQLSYARPSGVVSIVGSGSTTPTGDVIETGTNANGTYTKFADGTMICRGVMANFVVGANALANVSITYPTPFIDSTYNLTGSGQPVSTGDVYGFPYSISRTINGATLIYRNGATNQTISGNTYLAVGRWF